MLSSSYSRRQPSGVVSALVNCLNGFGSFWISSFALSNVCAESESSPAPLMNVVGVAHTVTAGKPALLDLSSMFASSGTEASSPRSPSFFHASFAGAAVAGSAVFATGASFLSLALHATAAIESEHVNRIDLVMVMFGAYITRRASAKCTELARAASALGLRGPERR